MERLTEKLADGRNVLKENYAYVVNVKHGSFIEGKAVEKLAEYEQAEEQGKLVLFPNFAYFIMNNEVRKGWVQEVVYSVCRRAIYEIRYDDNSLDFFRGYLGLTVFLTKAEAEQALAKMKGE